MAFDALATDVGVVALGIVPDHAHFRRIHGVFEAVLLNLEVTECGGHGEVSCVGGVV